VIGGACKRDWPTCSIIIIIIIIIILGSTNNIGRSVGKGVWGCGISLQSFRKKQHINLHFDNEFGKL
jgi:hypothetical protein